MSEEPIEKPKLIIDDDWKERVQSEKEAAAAASSAAAKEAPGASDAEAAETGSAEAETGSAGAGSAEAEGQASNVPDDAQPAHEMPPASFAMLVHSLTAQALASLGQIPDAEGKTNVDIGLGKHFIDTLAVLEEKTKGNLDEDESAALAKMLYELRMLFVHIRKDQQSPAAPAGEAAQDA